MARRRVTRKWEVFAGRNRFWCDGRVMCAPQPGVLLLTVALICGTCATHFVVDAPFLAARVSPLLPAGGALLAGATLAALLRTALSDPGVLPRAPPAAGPAPPRPPPRARDVMVRGRPVRLKYCFTCRMLRPPRASHCSLCDNCVERFDHHCPWVGNCVGRRNYRHFYTFVVSLSFLCVWLLGSATTHLALLARGSGLAGALRTSPATALVAAVCFLSVWSVLGLAGFHTYLAATDQTTNEDIKGSFSRSGAGSNPYSRGNPCANCWYVLCGPLPPSLIDRRGVVGDDDLPPHFSGVSVVCVPPSPVSPECDPRVSGCDPRVSVSPATDPHVYHNAALEGELHATTMIGAALDLDDPETTAATRASPAHGPALGPAHGPALGPAHGPALGPAHGPALGPAHGPALGPAHGPALGPAHGPAVGPAHGPVLGPAHGPAVAPVS